MVGSGVDDDPPWLATAYVPGPPLADVVSRHGPLAENAVWRLAAGLADALRAVHGCGLVHRDLKPGNVLLAADGPHVIDFGISRAFEGTAVTSAGMVVGTPGYMSPEQAEGQQAGPPSDVFSLGCVLAYAATGNAPFGGGSAASILYRVVTGEPDLSGIPASLRQVITACLAKDPAERIGLAQLTAMISALGPPLPGTIGAFWPEPLASIIAADQAPHPATQVSSAPADPAWAGPAQGGPGRGPRSGRRGSGRPGSGRRDVGGQAVMRAGRRTGLAWRRRAASSRGRCRPRPGTRRWWPTATTRRRQAIMGGSGSGGPVACAVPAARGRPVVAVAVPGWPAVPGQPAAGRPGRQSRRQPQPAAWPQSGCHAAQAGMPQPAGPQSAAPGSAPGPPRPGPQYGTPSWPQPGGPSGPGGPAPATLQAPWPQQQPSSGGSWPGGGQPSGPGGASYPERGDAAGAVRSRARGARPGPSCRPPVLGAVRLMYLGAVVTALNVVFGNLVKTRYSTNDRVPTPQLVAARYRGHRAAAPAPADGGQARQHPWRATSPSWSGSAASSASCAGW